jgi:predicted PurR-regulated permease PerM
MFAKTIQNPNRAFLFYKNTSYISLMAQVSLTDSIKVLAFLFLLFGGLFFAAEFLIPLSFGGIIATLILPYCRRIESKGVHRGVSAALCILILLTIIGGLVLIFAWQLSDLAKDFSQMQHHLSGLRDKIESYISNTVGISRQKQTEIIDKQQDATTSQMAGVITTLMGLGVDFILVTVYTFLFVFYRSRLKKFILMLVPAEQMQRTEKVINESAKVAFQYLSGLSMMIVMLWVMYGIGFSIIGIEGAIFFAVLCGLLEIVPFVGNLTGTGVTVLMAVSQGGGGDMVLGVLATYFVVQFVQTYIIEPMVVGAEVNINPLFTIIVLVLGEMLWGIPGMVLAIPLLGIAKIICDNVEPLRPYAYLIGGEGNKKKESGFINKIKKVFNKKAE